MTWFLDLRAHGSGGGVAQDVAIYDGDVATPLATFVDRLRNRDVLFATHGFNVNRKHGRNNLGHWEEWQSLPPDTIYVGLLWPGDSSWLPVIDYPIEGNEAIAAGKLLGSFIAANLREVATVSFASHSLGARMVLQTIRGLASAGRSVRRLLLMAGAIDDTCLNDEYAAAAAVVDRISILASHHDQVLHLAFPVGNFFAGIVTRGSPYWHAALGRDGPFSTLGGKVQQGWQIPDAWRFGHHHYLPQDQPAEASPPLPVDVPPVDEPNRPPWARFDEWRAAFSAGVNSTRYK